MGRDPISIRPAGPADAALAAEIYVLSSNAAFGPYQPVLELTTASIARWTVDLSNPGYHWWLAEVGGRTAGLVGMGPARDPSQEGDGELNTIAVLPQYWRGGLGRALMAVADDQLDQDGYLKSVLWTWRNYPTAEAFYAAVGWERTDLLRDRGRQVCYRRRQFGAVPFPAGL